MGLVHFLPSRKSSLFLLHPYSTPQSPEAVSAVGKLSYNQLVEKIITCKHSSDPNLVTEGDGDPCFLVDVMCREGQRLRLIVVLCNTEREDRKTLFSS